MKIGYKGTFNLTCLNHKFEIGQTYELQEKPIVCQCGFHYCVKPIDVLNYYVIQHDFRLLGIEDLSENTQTDGNKSATDKIRIIREISKEEYYSLFGFVGNTLTITDSNGYYKKYTYDERNNKIRSEDSNGYWLKFEYDDRNNLIHYKDVNNTWSKFEYDEQNNRIYYENNNGYWEKRQYDENNNFTMISASGYKV